MTQTLRNHILRNLGPSALRLELVNRLDNLCTLTGIPMSPELHRWVEDAFGLEMVRILEGYSSLTAPVISPQLQERINRIVPNNYQGENVNLMFKQQFDVSCAPQRSCYFYLHITCIPDLNFVNWEIDGQPFIANVNNLTGNSVFINSTAFQNEVFIWTIDDLDNLPTIPSYTDSFGNPSVYPIQWLQGQCDPICVQSIIPQLDIFSAPTLIRFIQPGLEYWAVAGIECTNTLGGNLDLSNPANIATANGFFQSLYPGSLLSVTDDGFGNWIVKLSNVYNQNQIVFEDQYGTLYYFNETPC